MRTWTHPLTLKALYALAMLRAFLKFRNPRRVRSGRNLDAFHARMWADAAGELGATYAPGTADFGEIARGAARTRVMGNVSAIDDPVTLALCHDKPAVHALLTAASIPVPTYAAFTQRTIAAAEAFMANAGAACVVKPAAGTGGGRGVTTGLTKISHLARAVAHAAVYSDELLIERQVEGENYRLLYLDGVLIDAFVRTPPHVVGDGRRSIAQLVDAANDERLAQQTKVSQVLVTVDQDMRRTLEHQGLTLRAVPAAGRRVTLKRVVNENGGADNATAVRLCPRVVEAGARAVEALRLRFGGVDIVTPDPTRPLEDVDGVVLELNGTPNLYFHYHKADGVVPVASILLETLLREATPRDERTTDRTPTAREAVS